VALRPRGQKFRRTGPTSPCSKAAPQQERPRVIKAHLPPLITRLEARLSDGYAEPEAVRLLVQARVSFGVALGYLLPEEQMATDARWTGRALRLAQDLGDRDLLASVLRMHGNELRKAGHTAGELAAIREYCPALSNSLCSPQLAFSQGRHGSRGDNRKLRRDQGSAEA
jgi:hypothetical protein